MSKFEIGDKVSMPGVPFVVEVLEIGACEDDGDGECELGGEIFRFKDPQTEEDDWMHSEEFRLVAAATKGRKTA